MFSLIVLATLFTTTTLSQDLIESCPTASSLDCASFPDSLTEICCKTSDTFGADTITKFTNQCIRECNDATLTDCGSCCTTEYTDCGSTTLTCTQVGTISTGYCFDDTDSCNGVTQCDTTVNDPYACYYRGSSTLKCDRNTDGCYVCQCSDTQCGAVDDTCCLTYDSSTPSVCVEDGVCETDSTADGCFTCVQDTCSNDVGCDTEYAECEFDTTNAISGECVKGTDGCLDCQECECQSGSSCTGYNTDSTTFYGTCGDFTATGGCPACVEDTCSNDAGCVNEYAECDFVTGTESTTGECVKGSDGCLDCLECECQSASSCTGTDAAGTGFYGTCGAFTTTGCPACETCVDDADCNAEGSYCTITSSSNTIDGECTKDTTDGCLYCTECSCQSGSACTDTDGTGADFTGTCVECSCQEDTTVTCTDTQCTSSDDTCCFTYGSGSTGCSVDGVCQTDPDIAGCLICVEDTCSNDAGCDTEFAKCEFDTTNGISGECVKGTDGCLDCQECECQTGTTCTGTYAAGNEFYGTCGAFTDTGCPVCEACVDDADCNTEGSYCEITSSSSTIDGECTKDTTDGCLYCTECSCQRGSACTDTDAAGVSFSGTCVECSCQEDTTVTCTDTQCTSSDDTCCFTYVSGSTVCSVDGVCQTDPDIAGCFICVEDTCSNDAGCDTEFAECEFDTTNRISGECVTGTDGCLDCQECECQSGTTCTGTDAAGNGFYGTCGAFTDTGCPVCEATSGCSDDQCSSSSVDCCLRYDASDVCGEYGVCEADATVAGCFVCSSISSCTSDTNCENSASGADCDLSDGTIGLCEDLDGLGCLTCVEDTTVACTDRDNCQLFGDICNTADDVEGTCARSNDGCLYCLENDAAPETTKDDNTGSETTRDDGTGSETTRDDGTQATKDDDTGSETTKDTDDDTQTTDDCDAIFGHNIPWLTVPDDVEGCTLKLRISLKLCVLNPNLDACDLENALFRATRWILYLSRALDIVCDEDLIFIESIDVYEDSTSSSVSGDLSSDNGVCPITEEWCGTEENDASLYKVEVVLTIKCSDCDDLKEVAALVYADAGDGTLGPNFAAQALQWSVDYDTSCGIGFGRITPVGTITVALYDAQGGEVLIEEINIQGNSNAVPRGVCVVVMLVLMMLLM